MDQGDLNWIIPGKFVAFMGPVSHRDPGQRVGFTPEEYAQIFDAWKVTKVVRLNDERYERKRFIRLGIDHQDLFFVDGSTPSDELVDEFILSSDEHFSKPGSGAIAVHCKAGLGRTGTLIGCWAMKHFKISAADFIGWVRIARPGSVLGP